MPESNLQNQEELKRLSKRVHRLESELSVRRENEKQFKLIAEAAHEGVLIHDGDKIVVTNASLPAMFGYLEEEVIGKSVFDFIPENCHDEIKKYILSGSTEPYDTYGLKKDGTVFPLAVRPTYITYMDRELRAASLRDITERVESNKAVKELNRIYRRYSHEVAIHTGQKFLNSVVRFLAEELGFDYCLIGRLIDPRTVRTVALYARGALAENIEYPLDGTPCDNVIGQDVCLYPGNIQELFPQDELLVHMDVNSYAGIPLFDHNGNSHGIIAVLGEKTYKESDREKISELIQVFGSRASSELQSIAYHEALEERTRQKDMLLKEVHHRTKNNLSIIQSLLSLQSRQVEDYVSKIMFRESQDRVRAISMIHERLSSSTSLTRVNFGEYVRSLATDLFRSYRESVPNVRLSVNVPDIETDAELMIPCGLLLNELVTNAVKYAYADSRRGELLITLRTPKEGHYELSVKDDGPGLPADVEPSTSRSLGMQIVNSLTSQLYGDIDIHRQGGTEFFISFRERQYR